MKKQHQIISGAVAVVFVLAAGGTWHVYNHMQTQKSMIESQMSRLQQHLPKEVKVTNTYESGLLNTKGIYTVTYNNGKISETAITQYTVDHGVGTWFGQDMQVHATTTLKGFLDPYLHYQGSFSTTEGTIAENGNMNLTVSHPALEVHIANPKDGSEQVKANLTPSQSTVSFDNISGDSKIVYKLSNIALSGVFDKKVESFGHVADIKIERNFNVSHPQLGQFDLNIGSIEGKPGMSDTVLFTAKNLDMNSGVELKANHYDFHGAFSVASITSPNAAFQGKEVKAKLSYFVKDLDVKTVNTFAEMVKKIQANEIQETPQTQAEFQTKLTDILKAGVSMGIDNFELQQGDDSVKLLQSVVIRPADKDGKFTLADNTSLEFYLAAKGQVAQVAYPGVSKLLGVELQGQDKNNFELSASYANHKLVLNKQPADIPFVDYINDELKGLDVALGFSKAEPSEDNTANGATPLQGNAMTLDNADAASTPSATK
jgi:hypothetical protein